MSVSAKSVDQYTTFFIGQQLYGINVMQVQEVTRPLAMTAVPRAPEYVCGLINLRGQIATAISLRRLFGIDGQRPEGEMNVVCRVDGMLFSFLVDRIGDVTEVDSTTRESTPSTIDAGVRRFIDGVCRSSGELLSIVNIEQICEVINSVNSNENRGEQT